MKFEHFALNVPNPIQMAEWYVRYLGMKIVLSQDAEPHARFLADETGRVVLEIYSNRAAPMPDHASIHHLNFHFAFAVKEAEETKAKLLAAGATYVEAVRPSDGSVIYMLRDPWGVPLQLCQRAKPFTS